MEKISGGGMAENNPQGMVLKEIQARLDRKLKESEIEVLEYWKGHLDRVTSMKPEGVAALQLQVKKIVEMMGNRIKILKREG